MKEQITDQNWLLSRDDKKIKCIKNQIHNERRTAEKESATELMSELDEIKKRTMEANSEKGTSLWLIAMPIQKYGYYLDKQTFRDALWLRYGFTLKDMPMRCVCGCAFNEIHALNCYNGGCINMRHDDIRDLTAEFISEVCNDVASERDLTPLSGEQLPPQTLLDDSARCDISARSFWMRGSKAYFDVMVFNPLAATHLKRKLSTVYSSMEDKKRKAYNHRIIEIEHGTFTPLVSSSFDYVVS